MTDFHFTGIGLVMVGLASFAPRKAYQTRAVGKRRLLISAFSEAGVLRFYVFNFLTGFLGFWPKRVSEHSQTQFYQVYWVKNCTTCLLCQTNWKNDLPKLINTSSHKMESFKSLWSQFLKVSNIFVNYSSGSHKDWKHKTGLKISHAIARSARYTVISTNWVSGHWICFRYSTSVPYCRVLRGHDFSRATKDSCPQHWARELTFSTTVHQMTVTTMVQSNVVPIFRWGAPITLKNGQFVTIPRISQL